MSKDPTNGEILELIQAAIDGRLATNNQQWLSHVNTAAGSIASTIGQSLFGKENADMAARIGKSVADLSLWGSAWSVVKGMGIDDQMELVKRVKQALEKLSVTDFKTSAVLANPEAKMKVREVVEDYLKSKGFDCKEG